MLVVDLVVLALPQLPHDLGELVVAVGRLLGLAEMISGVRASIRMLSTSSTMAYARSRCTMRSSVGTMLSRR